MTNKELAQRIREILAERGWQPGAGWLSTNGPICLVQAAGAALRDLPEYSPYSLSYHQRFERVNALLGALGFETRSAAVAWNDAQTDVQDIFERLDRVT